MMKKLKQKLEYESPKNTDEEEWFLENGSIFLEKLIADCNGKSIPIRSFSSFQILKATNNFDSSCLVKPLRGNRWYKGIIEDKPYLIKKFLKYIDEELVYNDIVLSARMSNHNNFLKLIGCCFEFRLPVVLFEYEEHAFLNGKGRIVVNGDKSKVLPWSARLKIAKDVAIAVTYLHTAFSRIIIHKSIMPSNISLDKNWNAKLTDFTISVSLPQGKSRIKEEKFMGVVTYFDPLYRVTRSLSEYTDVYSFGLYLFVFLIGRSSFSFILDGYRGGFIRYMKGLYDNGKIDEVIDPMIAKDIPNDQRLQVEAFVVLALRCCEEKEEDRPKMIQVAKELKRIEKIEQSFDVSSGIGFPKHEMLKDGAKYGQIDNEI